VLETEDKSYCNGRNQRHGRYDHSPHRSGSHDVGPLAGALAPSYYTGLAHKVAIAVPPFGSSRTDGLWNFSSKSGAAIVNLQVPSCFPTFVKSWGWEGTRGSEARITPNALLRGYGRDVDIFRGIGSLVIWRDMREPVSAMTLPLSWDEWSRQDGVALAQRVRAGELTANL